jgi:hypothetical protein
MKPAVALAAVCEALYCAGSNAWQQVLLQIS